MSEGGHLRIAIEGLVDFLNIDLNSHIQLENNSQIKLAVASDLGSIQVLIPYSTVETGHHKLALFRLNCCQLQNGLPEIIKLYLRTAYFREIAVNLRFGFEGLRMSFVDMKRKIKGFLVDLDLEDDPAILLKLREYIRVGRQDPRLNDFFKNLSVNKLSETRNNIVTFIRNCRNIFIESFRPGLSRMMVLLSYMISARPGLFETVEQLVKQALFVTDAFVSKSLAKEIQMRNFFTFLYISKLKTINPKKVNEYEDESFSNEHLDHYLLLETLNAKECLYLEDLSQIIMESRVKRDQDLEPKEDTFGNALTQPMINPDMEDEFNNLIQDLGLNSSEISSNKDKLYEHSLWNNGYNNQQVTVLILYATNL